MEIIFEKISFQPTRYELSKLKTFRNIIKRKKNKTHRVNSVLPSMTIKGFPSIKIQTNWDDQDGMIFYFNPSTSRSSLLHLVAQYEHVKRTPYFTFYLMFTCICYSARQVTITTTLSLPPKDDQGAFPVRGNKLIKDIYCDFLQKNIYICP